MAKTTGCGTNCFAKHPFSGSNRDKCEQIKDCVCRCEPLKAENLNLFEGCKGACQNRDNQPKNHQDYKCNFIGPDTLFNHYQLVDCGYDPLKDSLQGKLSEEANTKTEARIRFEQFLMIGLFIAVLVLGYELVIKSKK